MRTPSMCVTLQAAAGMGVFGPRTIYCIALKDAPGCQEFLLQDDGKWVHVKETTEIGEALGLLMRYSWIALLQSMHTEQVSPLHGLPRPALANALASAQAGTVHLGCDASVARLSCLFEGTSRESACPSSS